MESELGAKQHAVIAGDSSKTETSHLFVSVFGAGILSSIILHQKR